ncbi:MAG: RDD family protein [Candidatus Nanopelagicales bacterium]
MTEPQTPPEPARTHRPDPIPQNARPFQGLRAGVVSRTAAGAIDYLIITSLTFGTWLGIAILRFLIDPRDFSFPQWPVFWFVILGYCYMVLYLTVCWATTGRSVGSGLLGLRVVGRKGMKLSWPLSFVRASFCTLVPVALFWCVVSRENRSVQDVLLRTSVIHDWPVRKDFRVTDVGARSEL